MSQSTETNGKSTIHLSVMTPAGTIFDGECDSLTFEIEDGADGSFGGSVGIHPGHTPALAALKKNGTVRAMLGGTEILNASLDGGAATVSPFRTLILTGPEAHIN